MLSKAPELPYLSDYCQNRFQNSSNGLFRVVEKKRVSSYGQQGGIWATGESKGSEGSKANRSVVNQYCKPNKRNMATSVVLGVELHTHCCLKECLHNRATSPDENGDQDQMYAGLGLLR